MQTDKTEKLKAQRLDSIRKLQLLTSKVQYLLSSVLWRRDNFGGYFCVFCCVWVFYAVPCILGDTSYVKSLILVILVRLNRDVNPINTLELHCVAIQTSILCSSDHESSCFTVLKVKKDLLRLFRVIVCRDSCGKNFDSSNIPYLVIHWIPSKGFVGI